MVVVFLVVFAVVVVVGFWVVDVVAATVVVVVGSVVVVVVTVVEAVVSVSDDGSSFLSDGVTSDLDTSDRETSDTETGVLIPSSVAFGEPTAWMAILPTSQPMPARTTSSAATLAYIGMPRFFFLFGSVPAAASLC